MLIRETLRKSGAEIVFASLFGSYRRGDYDAHSDIDIFVVYEGEDEKPRISLRLKRLEQALGRPVHMNLFSLKEFESRVRLHDYLMASIIEDSSFILGRSDVFYGAKRSILEARPDEEAVRFNRQMGLKTLRYVCSLFDNLDSVKSSHSGSLLDRAVRGLNDYRLALGYIYASGQMQRTGRGVSPTRILQTGFGSPLKEIAHVEMSVKRGLGVDHGSLRRLIDVVKDKSSQILEASQDSPARLLSLIKSFHAKPVLWAV